MTNTPQLQVVADCGNLEKEKWPSLDLNDLCQGLNHNREHHVKEKILEGLLVNPFLDISVLKPKERLDLLLFQKKEGLVIVDFIFLYDSTKETDATSYVNMRSRQALESILDEEVKNRYNLLFETADVDISPNLRTIRLSFPPTSKGNADGHQSKKNIISNLLSQELHIVSTNY